MRPQIISIHALFSEGRMMIIKIHTLTHISQKPECPQSYNNNICCSPCAREPVVTSAISALLSRMMWGGSL